MEISKFITIFFIAFFYIIGIFITKVCASGYLEAYGERYLFISTSAERYINSHLPQMATMCALMFPLYLCFLYGSFFAKHFYKILIEDKDENRIASWLF